MKKYRYFCLVSRFASLDFEQRIDSEGKVEFWGWHIWAGRAQCASPLRLHYSWTPRRTFLFQPAGAERRLTLTTRRYAGIGITMTTRRAKQRIADALRKGE